MEGGANGPEDGGVFVEEVGDVGAGEHCAELEGELLDAIEIPGAEGEKLVTAGARVEGGGDDLGDEHLADPAA